MYQYHTVNSSHISNINEIQQFPICPALSCVCQLRRDRIPNVPADTKLSKIKTLRLATSYICYLMEVLENDDCGDGFKADLPSQPRRVSSTAAHLYNGKESENSRKSKGRTGWPQHVWALELKQEAL
ncbi:unnamed protein product [Nesidiocoris tenuis]|uniref:BHLH domain-containing protein n=1 Tax=Nesidiocoris tenuis TaxID=355587 RepID=A0A6H5FTA7_9HEMI|nr:unnamed protein product [Nesidiocoris tenuis]CAA9993237.1 unnamed protein product [Nesidiocoris tenuis]